MDNMIEKLPAERKAVFKSKQDKRKERELKKLSDCWSQQNNLKTGPIPSPRLRSRRITNQHYDDIGPSPPKIKKKTCTAAYMGAEISKPVINHTHKKFTNTSDDEGFTSLLPNHSLTKQQSCNKISTNTDVLDLNHNKPIDNKNENIRKKSLFESLGYGPLSLSSWNTVTKKVKVSTNQISDNDIGVNLTPKQQTDFIQINRKKLRSELSNEELWEGFPTDVKIPRLKFKKTNHVRSISLPESYTVSNKLVSHNIPDSDKCQINVTVCTKALFVNTEIKNNCTEKDPNINVSVVESFLEPKVLKCTVKQDNSNNAKMGDEKQKTCFSAGDANNNSLLKYNYLLTKTVNNDDTSVESTIKLGQSTQDTDTSGNINVITINKTYCCNQVSTENNGGANSSVQLITDETIKSMAMLQEQYSNNYSVKILSHDTDDTAVDLMPQDSNNSSVKILSHDTDDTVVDVMPKDSNNSSVKILSHDTDDTVVNLMPQDSNTSSVMILSHDTDDTVVNLMPQDSNHFSVKILSHDTDDTVVNLMPQDSNTSSVKILSHDTDDTVVNLMPKDSNTSSVKILSHDTDDTVLVDLMPKDSNTSSVKILSHDTDDTVLVDLMPKDSNNSSVKILSYVTDDTVVDLMPQDSNTSSVNFLSQDTKSSSVKLLQQNFLDTNGTLEEIMSQDAKNPLMKLQIRDNYNVQTQQSDNSLVNLQIPDTNNFSLMLEKQDTNKSTLKLESQEINNSTNMENTLPTKLRNVERNKRETEYTNLKTTAYKASVIAPKTLLTMALVCVLENIQVSGNLSQNYSSNFNVTCEAKSVNMKASSSKKGYKHCPIYDSTTSKGTYVGNNMLVPTSIESKSMTRSILKKSLMKTPDARSETPNEVRVLTRLKAKTPEKFGLNVARELIFKSLPKPSVKKRKSSTSDLFEDKRLAKNASALWLSERRRHFQQQHPKATGQQLNEMMRTAWEKLPARQKLIYFVRAKAVADDKKTSKETDRKQTKIEKQHIHLKTTNITMDIFIKYAGFHQDCILKEKLSILEKELSRDLYKDFLNIFYQKYKEEINMKYLNGLGLPADEGEKIARLVLFDWIGEVEQNIADFRKERYSHHKKVFHQQYHALIEDIIKSPGSSGHISNSPKHEIQSHSESLCDVLISLSEIFQDVKTKDINDFSNTPKYKRILNELEHGSCTGMLTLKIGGEDINIPNIVNCESYRSLLMSALEQDLAVLDANQVEECLQL